MLYFFSVDHIHYASYIYYHLSEMPNISPEMKLDSVSSAHVHRHHAGYCNTVSSVQFGERIAIIYENEGLKEITCSAEIDAE